MDLENALEGKEDEQETGPQLFDSAVNTRTLAKYIRQIEPRKNKYDSATRKKPLPNEAISSLGETNTLTENFIKFQIVLTAEVEKVNNFYELKEEALLADWEVFLKSLEVEREVERITQNKRKSWVSKYIDFHRLFKKFKNMFTIFGHKHESLDEFTESLINFYRRTNVLINFSNLNFIAIEQLLLKYERILDKNTRQNLLANINKKTFISSENCYRLRREIEAVYAQRHTDGNIKRARAFLRSEKIPNSSFFFAGTYTSLILCLATVNLIMLIFYNRYDLGYLEAFPVFRALGLPLLFLWAWSLLMFSWERTNVNYLFIMQFQEKTFTLLDSVKFATFFSTIWFVCFFLYLGTVNRTLPNFLLLSIAENIYPFIMALMFLFFFILPMNFLSSRARFGFMKSLFHISVAPFGRLQFSDFFLADFIISSIPILVDLGYTVCWVCLGGFIQIPNSTNYENITNATPSTPCLNVRNAFIVNIIPFFPYWWRLAQTFNKIYNTKKFFPHFVNSIKYFSGLVTIAALTSQRILNVWDIKMDWGLFRKGSHVLFLRDEALLIARWKYYAIILIDLVMRFLWIAELYFFGAIFGEVYFPLFEMIRRSLWAYFRVELESLVNWEQYRTVDFVPSHLHSRHLHYLNNFSPKSPSYRFDVEDLMSGLHENEMLLSTQHGTNRDEINADEELKELRIDRGDEEEDEEEERSSRNYAYSTTSSHTSFDNSIRKSPTTSENIPQETIEPKTISTEETSFPTPSPTLKPSMQLGEYTHVSEVPINQKEISQIKGEYEGECSQPTGYEGEYKGEYGGDFTQPTGEFEGEYVQPKGEILPSKSQIKGEYEVSDLIEPIQKTTPSRKSVKGEYEVSDESSPTASKKSIRGEYEVSDSVQEATMSMQVNRESEIEGNDEKHSMEEGSIHPTQEIPMKQQQKEENIHHRQEKRENKSEREWEQLAHKGESKLKKLVKGIHRHEQSETEGEVQQSKETLAGKSFPSKGSHSQKGEYFVPKSSIYAKGEFSPTTKPTKGEYEQVKGEKKIEYERSESENKNVEYEKREKKHRESPKLESKKSKEDNVEGLTVENPLSETGLKRRPKKTLKIKETKKGSDQAGT